MINKESARTPRACLAIQRRACTGCRARRGPRDGVVGSGNHSLPRYFFHMLRSVKLSNDPRDASDVHVVFPYLSRSTSFGRMLKQQAWGSSLVCLVSLVCFVSLVRHQTDQRNGATTRQTKIPPHLSRLTLHFVAYSNSDNSTFNIDHSTFPMPPHVSRLLTASSRPRRPAHPAAADRSPDPT